MTVTHLVLWLLERERARKTALDGDLWLEKWCPHVCALVKYSTTGAVENEKHVKERAAKSFPVSDEIANDGPVPGDTVCNVFNQMELEE